MGALGVLALVLAWVQFVRQAEPEARSVTATGEEEAK